MADNRGNTTLGGCEKVPLLENTPYLGTVENIELKEFNGTRRMNVRFSIVTKPHEGKTLFRDFQLEPANTIEEEDTEHTDEDRKLSASELYDFNLSDLSKFVRACGVDPHTITLEENKALAENAATELSEKIRGKQLLLTLKKVPNKKTGGTKLWVSEFTQPNGQKK